MLFQGKYDLRTPREKLWKFINDPAKIGNCLPDLKNLQIESADRFLATVSVGVGPIKSDFKFRIEIVERQPISRVRLKAVGNGTGSSITIDTIVELAELQGGTALSYVSEAIIGGMIASLGQRLIRETADKTISRVFTCVKQQLE